MVGATPDAFADALATRHEFLRALANDPASKRTLEDRLDVSRSTIDRAVRELESQSLVAYEDRQYHLTPAGRNGLRAYERTTNRIRSLVAAGDVLEALPHRTPLDPAVVAGAEIARTSPQTPDTVVSHLLESVRPADHVDGVAPVALTGHLDTFYEEATADGGSVHMLVECGLFDYLVSADDDPLRPGLEDPNVRLERAPVPFEFGLWLADDREVGVVIYTETGVKAVIVNDDSEAVAWAREQFDRIAETSTPAGETDVAVEN